VPIPTLPVNDGLASGARQFSKSLRSPMTSDPFAVVPLV